MTLLHIAFDVEWEAEGGDASSTDYAPADFAREGYVHCSYAHQLVATASRYYAGRKDVVLLEIDEAQLASPVIVEPSPSTGEMFPHIYGRIPRSAVLHVHEFRPDARGEFSLPDGIARDT